jgi:DNA-binding NtrC family response regulator
LNVLPIQLPTLRERKNDIEALASYFIEKFNTQHHKQITHISPEAMAILKAHSWPGNIRELENVIEHAFVIETLTEITVQSLPDNLVETLMHQYAQHSTNQTTYQSPKNKIINLSHENTEQRVVKHTEHQLTQDINRLDFQANKEEFERQFLIKALKAFRGRINQTALHANIPKKTLLRKLEKYGINARDYAL